MTQPEPRKLREYQVAAVDEVEKAWSQGDQRVSVVLPTGSGKSQPLDTLIPTPKGILELGSLKPGDYVFTHNGEATEITHIHPQGVRPTVIVGLSDGTSTIVDIDHLWEVTNEFTGETKTLPTHSLLTKKFAGFTKLPMAGLVEYTKTTIELDPLKLGKSLASGHRRFKTKFRDKEIAQRNGFTESPSSFFIPEEYLVSTVDDRIALLDGILSVPDISQISHLTENLFTCESRELAYGFQRLVWSLGGTAQRTTAQSFRNGRLVIEYRVEFELPFYTRRSNNDANHMSIPFNDSASLVAVHNQVLSAQAYATVFAEGITQLKERGVELPVELDENLNKVIGKISALSSFTLLPVASTETAPERHVVSIQPHRDVECMCITVAHPSGLYLTGVEHIVTHNSTVIASLASKARASGKRAVLLAHRNELLEQMADSVHMVDPSGEDVGFVVADQDDPNKDIVVASFQTLSRSPKRLAALGHRDVILADECFVAGTKVGDVNIEDIEIGDLVPSYDEKFNEFVQRRVTAVMKSVPEHIVRVTFETGHAVVCTSGHRFLTVEHGWRPAAYIDGDTVISDPDRSGIGNHVRAESVEWLQRGEDGTFNGELTDGLVYNIEVEGTHTYVLGDGGFVVHNCHHISAPTYLKVLDHLGAMNPNSGVKSCGFTATMYRDDKKALGEVWDKVVFERDLKWGIESGFLIAPKGKTVAIEGLNKLSQIKNVAGDYKQSDLDEVMGASVDSTVDAILRHCPNSAMIVFAVSVEHARTLAEKLTACGIPSRDVTGGHNREYREAAYADFRLGNLDCLVTVQVLTEGADFPRCDTVVMARPTRSKVLFCFDSETEILTPNGWVNGLDLKKTDSVAQWNPDTNEISFIPPSNSFVRDRLPDERMVSLQLPATDIRVTENHRIYYKPKWALENPSWRVAEAIEFGKCPGTSVALPSAGVSEFEGIPLTDDEIRLVAWITADGSISKTTNGVAISQSKPVHVNEIKRVITNCGIKYTTRINTVSTNFGQRTNPLHIMTISKGTPRGIDKHLRGWGYLDDWMFKSNPTEFQENAAKNIRERWELCTESQWDIFMNVLDAANGANTSTKNLGWTPRSYHIAISNEKFADWVQSMCVQRGWSTSIALHKDRDNLWILHAKKITKRHVGGADGRPTWQIEDAYREEKVWCVTVPTGAVVTRRRGKAVILGNCQMVGRSVRPYTDPKTGVAKTDATVLDLTGVVRDIKLSSLTDLYQEAEQQYFDSDGKDRSEDDDFLDTLLSRPDKKKERQGQLNLEDIDLFDDDAGLKRKVLWLRTGPINAAGDELAFIPQKSSKTYTFLYPPVTKMGGDVTVGVGHLDEHGMVSFAANPTTGEIVRGTLTQAMDFAEKRVGPKEYIRLDANWRRFGGQPSEKQVALGRNLGIVGFDKLDRAGLSDEITKFFATRLFRDAARKYAL